MHGVFPLLLLFNISIAKHPSLTAPEENTPNPRQLSFPQQVDIVSMFDFVIVFHLYSGGRNVKEGEPGYHTLKNIYFTINNKIFMFL